MTTWYFVYVGQNHAWTSTLYVSSHKSDATAGGSSHSGRTRRSRHASAASQTIAP